jgi:succinoglycan biosynthesis transport protein ExoP
VDQSAKPVEASSPNLSDYLRILYRRRWLAVLTFVIVTPTVASYGMLQSPAYEAGVRLVLNPEPTAPVAFEAAARPQDNGPDAQTQQEVLRSHEVVRQTILALRLWERPAAASLNAPSLLTRLKRAIHLDREVLAAEAAPPATDDSRAEALVPVCAARIKVVAVPLSKVFDVVFEAPDAQLAADFSNQLAKQFIRRDVEARATSARDAVAWLTTQVDAQKRKVEASDEALQRYKEERGALSVDDRQNIVAQKLSDLNTAATKARSDRLARESAYRQVQQAQGKAGGLEALEAIPAIAADSSVRQARTQLSDLQRQLVEASQRYGDRHPTIVKLQASIQTAEKMLQDRVNTAADVIKNEYLDALGQEQAQARGLEDQKKSVLELNEQHLEYSRLQREADTNHQIFNALLQQLNQGRITGNYDRSPIEVVEQARPPVSPVRPQRTKFAALGLAVGLCAALGLAFVRELADPRVKTPQQLQQLLQMPLLGLIPDTTPAAGEERPTFIQVPPSPFADALRRVRANLRLAAPGPSAQILLVTSAAPREGKTTICVSLAQCFAIAMPRVLVIDADLRRSSVHRTLGLHPREGLADYLAGRTDLDNVLQPTGFENLWVIPAGKPRDNPSELLGLARMSALLDAVRGRFDWILIDTAPVLSAPDAGQLAPLASGILFVVSADMTPREDVLRAEQELMRTRVPFAGCVLNRARVERHGYYYAPYYNKGYESYYSQEPSS